jgi:hypothetical protein
MGTRNISDQLTYRTALYAMESQYEIIRISVNDKTILGSPQLAVQASQGSQDQCKPSYPTQ